MNHEQPLPFPEPSDNELDDALHRFQDDTDEMDVLLTELDTETIIAEHLAMDSLHIAGLPMEFLKESRNALGPDAPIVETLEILTELQLVASLQDDLENEQAIEVAIRTGLIVQRIASNMLLYDIYDPVSAAEVRKEEQLYFLNDETLSVADREKVLCAINLLYEEGSGLDMSNPQTLFAAEEHRAQEVQARAIKDGSQVIREMLTTIATEYMKSQGVIEHDDKDAFVAGVVVAVSREYAVESGLVAVDQLTAESTKQASALRLELSRSEARKMGWIDEQFDGLVARLRSSSSTQ